MNEANYITPNLDEGYSPEAIANMENALEEFHCIFVRYKARRMLTLQFLEVLS